MLYSLTRPRQRSRPRPRPRPRQRPRLRPRPRPRPRKLFSYLFTVVVLPMGFLKHCIHRTYSDTKNGGNCLSGALISKDIFANFASLRLGEKKTFKVARFYTGVYRQGATFAKFLFMGRSS